MSISFSWDQVLAYRTRKQQLVCAGIPHEPTKHASPREVVSQVVGLQSQVPNAALMGLWARIPDFTLEKARQAVSSGELIRMWSLRGTVHLHAPEDRAMIAAAVGRHQAALTLRWMQKDELSSAEALDMAAQVSRALRERPMNRQELAEALASTLSPEKVHWITGGWGGVIRLASLYGDVCFDPAASGASFAAVATDGDDLSIEEARSALIRRYLASYGPAPASDFAFYVGLPAPVARKAAQEAEGLVSVSVEGKDGLIPEECLDELVASTFDADQPAVSLLPHFDSYMMGHRDKTPVLDPGYNKAVFRQAGWVSPVLLIDGRAAGVWSYRSGTRSVVVDVQPFEALGQRAKDLIETRIMDLGSFFGLQVRHTFQPPLRA